MWCNDCTTLSWGWPHHSGGFKWNKLPESLVHFFTSSVCLWLSVYLQCLSPPNHKPIYLFFSLLFYPSSSSLTHPNWKQPVSHQTTLPHLSSFLSVFIIHVHPCLFLSLVLPLSLSSQLCLCCPFSLSLVLSFFLSTCPWAHSQAPECASVNVESEFVAKQQLWRWQRRLK